MKKHMITVSSVFIVVLFLLTGCSPVEPTTGTDGLEQAIEIVDPHPGDQIVTPNTLKIVTRYDENTIAPPLKRHFSTDEGRTWIPMTVDIIGLRNYDSENDTYRYEVMVWDPTVDKVKVQQKVWIRMASYDAEDRNDIVKDITVE